MKEEEYDEYVRRLRMTIYGKEEQMGKARSRSACEIRPVRGNVLVKFVEDGKETEGGILLPDRHEERTKKAKVIAVGPGRVLEDGRLLSPAVTPGDVIITTKFSGTRIEVEGVEYRMLTENEIVGVLKEEQK